MRKYYTLSIGLAAVLAFDAAFLNGELLHAFMTEAAEQGYKFRSGVGRITEKLFF